MRSTSLLLFFFTAIGLSAQENSASAFLVTAQDWFPPATTYTTSNLGTSGSGLPTCQGIDVDDCWFRFTATTQAAKIIIQNPAFNAVIELYNNSLDLVACENTVVANATETMRVSNLVIGDQYLFRVHSFDGLTGTGVFQYAVEYYPLAEVRSGWYPTYTPDDAIPGYKVYQTVNRTNYGISNNMLIQATRWTFTDTQTGEQCTVDVNGSNAQVLLNNAGCICYDKFYDVMVQVKVENWWCGYSNVRTIDMENYPTTWLEPTYAGQYYNMDDDLKAIFVGNDQVIQWELYTDNGQTVLTHTSTSSYLYFNEVPCIRYNKIYNVRTRCSYCGGPFGPWSNFSYVIVNPLPYTNVKPQYCDTWQYVGATLLCDFIDVADQYAWQFAPIEPGDETMTPIGPATVVYSSFTNLYLLNLGLELGQTYRVGVKPFVGYNDSCDDVQEGDYGYFCPVSIINPFGTDDDITDMALDNSDVTVQVSEKELVTLSTFVSGEKILTVKTSQELEGNGMLKIFDVRGEMVLNRPVYKLEEASFLQFPVSGISSGMYVVVLEASGEVVTEKIVIGN